MTDIVQTAETAAAIPSRTERPAAGCASAPSHGGGPGWVFALPAIFLIVLFVITPLVSAFVVSFTNERLVSGNETEWVGPATSPAAGGPLPHPRPIVDEATGEPEVDEKGNVVYPAVREFTRNNPDHPDLDGLQEWFTFGIGDTRTSSSPATRCS